MPWPSVIGHTLVRPSAFCAHGTLVMLGLGWSAGHCWSGRGSDTTGTGTDGVDLAVGFDDGLDEGLGDGLAATTLSGPVAEPAAATAGAWAAATRARPAAQTAIRLIRAASVNRRIFRIRKRT